MGVRAGNRRLRDIFLFALPVPFTVTGGAGLSFTRVLVLAVVVVVLRSIEEAKLTKLPPGI